MLYPLFLSVPSFSSRHPKGAKNEIIERIKSMVFLCLYSNSENPVTLSVIDFEYDATGPYATAFFICPNCQNKFVIKIQVKEKFS
jgi:hypothetical protein